MLDEHCTYSNTRMQTGLSQFTRDCYQSSQRLIMHVSILFPTYVGVSGNLNAHKIMLAGTFAVDMHGLTNLNGRDTNVFRNRYSSALKSVFHNVKIEKQPRAISSLSIAQTQTYSPIVAQMGAYDQIIEHMKVLERVESARLDKGLGKNRKKGHSNRGKAQANHLKEKREKKPKYSVVPGQKSSCMPRDHKESSKLLLDKTLDLIVPQIWTPAVTVTPDAGTSAKIDELTRLLSGFSEQGVDFNINLGFMDTIKTMVSSIDKAIDLKKVGAVSLMALIIYCGRKAYLAQEEDPIVAQGFPSFKTISVWACLFTVLSTAVSMFYSKELSSFVQAARECFIWSRDKIRPQIGKESIRDSLLAALYGLIAVGSMTKKTVSERVLSAFKSMGDLPKISSGLDFTVEWFSDIAQRLINFVANFFEKDPYILTDHPFPESLAYIAETEKVLADFNSNTYELTADYGSRIFELENKGNRIAGDIDTRTAAGQRAFRTTNVAIRGLKPIIERLRRSNIVGNGPRIPPIGVVIGGATNIGKSHVIQFLMKQCGAHMVPPDKRASYVANVNNHIYNVVSENRFWDNYTGQTVVCVDDLFQAVDVAGNPANEAFNVIRMINQNNFPLTMAHLEDKGNVNFTSKLIVGTTNMSSFKHLKSVVKPEAVARRFKISYAAQPREAFRFTKFGASADDPFSASMKSYMWPEDPADFSHIEFVPWDFATGKRKPGEAISFDQLQAEIVAMYKKDRAFGEKTLKSHQVKLQEEIDKLNAMDGIEAQIFIGQEPLRFSPEMLRTMPTPLMVCSGPNDPIFPSVLLQHLRSRGFSDDEELFHEFLSLDPVRRLFAASKTYDETMAIVWPVWLDFRECVPQIGVDHVSDGDSDDEYEDGVEDLETIPRPPPQPENLRDAYSEYMGQMGADELEALKIKPALWKTIPGRLALIEMKVIYANDPNFLMCIHAHFNMSRRGIHVHPDIMKEALSSNEAILILAKDDSWGNIELDLLDLIQSFRYNLGDLSTSETLKKYIDDMAHYLAPIEGLLWGIARFATIFTLSRVISTYISSYFATEVEGQSETGVRHSTSNPRATKYRTKSPRFSSTKFGKSGSTVVSVEGQAGVEDKSCLDMIHVILEKSTYRMKVKDCNGFMGTITFVKDTHALAPLHFGGYLDHRMQNLDTVDTIELWRDGAKTPAYSIPLDEMSSTVGGVTGHADFTVLTFPDTHVNRHRDILDKFMSGSGALHSTKFSIYLPIYRKKWVIHSSWAAPKGAIHYKVGDDPEPYRADDTFEYDVPTELGDCGNLMYVRDTRSIPKILGLHVAGHGHRGISNVVERGWIESAIKAYEEANPGDVGTVVVDKAHEINDDALSSDALLEEIKGQGFTPITRATRPLHTPTTTVITPSRLHGTFCKSRMKPTHLRPFRKEDGEVCDPMCRARAKYSAAPTAISSRLVQGVSEIIYSKIVNDSIFDMSWKNPRVFTFEEACAGIPDVPFFEGLPRGTSAGYPLSLDVPKGFTGKQHIFGKEGPYTFDTIFARSLRAEVARCEDDARKGIRNLHVYSDFLKDERRDVAKADAGKARMVSGAPLAHTVLMRMYFGDFVRHIMANRVKNGIAVGINTFKEWDDLAKLLRNRSASRKPNCMAGDYEGYDGSLIAVLMLIFLYLANRWYSDGNDKIREILFMDIINSRHICKDVIYEWFGSNPSGCFLTACLNSVVNLAAIYIASLICMIGEDEYHKTNWHTFDWHVYGPKLLHDVTPVTFGDDNIIGITDNIRHLIDQNKFTRALGLIGFKYTPEDKVAGELAVPLRPVEEITFLKRSFKINPTDGRYTCPLQLDVILEMPQWTKKGDLGAIEKTNITTALEELSLHPRSVFNHWSPKILKAAQENLEFTPLCVDYQTLQARKMASTGYHGSA